MVNITITPDMTKEMIIEIAHKATAVPGMILLFAVFSITLILAAWGFKEKDTSWGRFFLIWGTTMIIVGIFLVFFIFSPGAIQWVVTKWEILWS